MTKETTIIFLYDIELLKHEEDDPNSAILYFYPTWVSDHQKTALCGQLIGTVLCLRGLFSMPKIVSLQTGKFCLIENGRYILVVGTDRNIPDWVLEHRANLLYSLVNFFHQHFVALGLSFEGENLRAKLYHIFDTYLKLLYLGGSIFSNMPLWDLSKTDTNILKSSKAFLDDCKCVPNVLGGTLLYHNKVIVSQLSTQTTKTITISDPYRISNPAEISDQYSDLPPGVKLVQVFIPVKELQALTCSASFVNFCKGGNVLIKGVRSILEPDKASTSVSILANKREKRRARPNSLVLSSCCADSAEHLRATPAYAGNLSLASTPMSEKRTFIDPPDSSSIKLDRSLETLQYFNRSIKLNRRNSVNDPLSPWTKDNNKIGLSQYLVNEVLCKEKVNIAEKKGNLALPIKPHNASEPQRFKSPSGYLTPLMNKLASADAFSLRNSSLNKVLSRNNDHVVKSDEKEPPLQRCLLFLQGERDLVLALLITEDGCLEELYKLCTERLGALEKHLEEHLINPIKSSSEKDLYSILNLSPNWDTVVQFGLWENFSDLTHLHENFMKHQLITDVYLRKPEAVVFGRKEGEEEVYFQENAQFYKGLLPPNDALGMVHHSAKKKLEKNHCVIIK
ncbi:BLOC-3 complex member HPS4 [Euwallacea similis]|uniref:BLOC-3 complex member HPS4 n=1 Tax=Euwallacea similis TaxID=1736056 RepID=UPI00344B80D8